MRKPFEPKSFTEEQLNQARSVGLLEFLQHHEPYNLKQSSRNEYTYTPHDSFKLSNGKWNWFSQEIGGHSALDFLVKYKNMSFVDAVKMLINDNDREKYVPTQAQEKKPIRKNIEFELPSPNTNNNKVISYLRSREISPDTIQKCLDNGSLYESKGFGNAVFVGFDGNEPKYALQKGTQEGENNAFQGEKRGSIKNFGFCIPPEKDSGKTTVAVFESPIDALAHNTLMEMARANGDMDFDGYRLSLGGKTPGALEEFLDKNPQINRIYLCLDNDIYGRNATNKIAIMLKTSSEHKDKIVEDRPPKHGKDYADTLVVAKQKFLQIENQKRQAEKELEKKHVEVTSAFREPIEIKARNQDAR